MLVHHLLHDSLGLFFGCGSGPQRQPALCAHDLDEVTCSETCVIEETCLRVEHLGLDMYLEFLGLSLELRGEIFLAEDVSHFGKYILFCVEE